MTCSKLFSIVGATMLCATVAAADASAQSRGRSGGRGPSGRGPSVGRSAPRGPSAGRVTPRGSYGGSYRVGGGYLPGYRYSGRSLFFPRFVPYARYYYPYRPGFSFGFYAGLGYPYYYGYPYSYYGGYPYYASPHYADPYGYGGYGYGYPYGGSVAARPGGAWGEVRIEDAPKDAQVFADGRLVGSVGDFDGPVRHLPLEAGSHEIEIRIGGMPPLTYDVEVRPGQTLTIHANVR